MPVSCVVSDAFCTDLHTAAAHIGLVDYPCVPGHELAGVCVAVGRSVTRVRVGDHIGVGCIVDSCLNCPACTAGQEQKCTVKRQRKRLFDTSCAQT